MTFNGGTYNMYVLQIGFVIRFFVINKSVTEILYIVAVRPRSFISFYFVCVALISNVRATKSHLRTTLNT